MENDIQELQRKYAALAYALGVTRGVLSDVIDADFTVEHVKQIYEATAAARIAESIGLSENALDIYWDKHLTDAEKRKIQGYN